MNVECDFRMHSQFTSHNHKLIIKSIENKNFSTNKIKVFWEPFFHYKSSFFFSLQSNFQIKWQNIKWKRPKTERMLIKSPVDKIRRLIFLSH